MPASLGRQPCPGTGFQAGPCRTQVVLLNLGVKPERPDPRSLLAAIVASSDDAIVSKTLDGIVTSWNQGATRLFGYEADEMVGQHITRLFPPGREDEEPRIIERIRRGERVDHFETKRRHKDGHLLDVSLTISPIRDDSGEIIGASKIARDITDRMEAQAAREEAAALRGAVAEAESFGYMVSHDLRTPLRAIEGFSQRLQREVDRLTPDGRESLQYIVGAARKMSNTIDGLMQLTRVGRTPLRRQDTDLSQVARGVVAELRANTRRDVQAVVPDGIHAYADPDLAVVVLSNLLGNAWKFTRRQPQARIEFGVVGPHDQPLSYFVRDNGIGFAPGDAKDLFTAFTRLNPGGEFEGTGIGLATVRRAIERHGGKVWIDAKPGEGAQVSFTFGPNRTP